jgi:hydroxymethylpyrimidine/phosphomethylpyrimidine kinase
MKSIPNVLTIAGSDSGGGAGIQADIKAISATGSYACSVITAITAQNTQGVSAVMPISTHMVSAQLDSVFSDLTIDAVKIGMLADADIIKTVADKLRQYQPKHIVLDPVMVATSGDSLIQSDAVQALIDQLIPLATVITPNIPEAVKLNGKQTEQGFNAAETAKALLENGANGVLVKGGHSQGASSDDILVTSRGQHLYSAERVETNNTHGTGCTLSSAIASYLAQGYELAPACDMAKQYITKAICAADRLNVGKGHGPVNHFYQLNH